MHIEINQAAEFLGRFLQPKIDADSIQNFKHSLMELLAQRFTNHWDAQQPYRGNGYRAISNFHGQLDPIIIKACDKATCPIHLVHSNLPRDFVLWVDPYNVSYRVGDHGNIMTLYEDDPRKPHPPKASFLQSTPSTPIRMSPPSSPESRVKKMNKTHQPSPLSYYYEQSDENMVMVN
ncbi:hypothetical protein EDC96DRAFT_498915 [Choanephora cucurbitarum]|nr:hypothetical protein EDC96DRAFT_498915 [Choanephora cucurbitarum]